MNENEFKRHVEDMWAVASGDLKWLILALIGVIVVFLWAENRGTR